MTLNESTTPTPAPPFARAPQAQRDVHPLLALRKLTRDSGSSTRRSQNEIIRLYQMQTYLRSQKVSPSIGSTSDGRS
jgi:hypothetical protein